MRVVLMAVLGLAAAGAVSAATSFSDVTEDAGIDYVHYVTPPIVDAPAQLAAGIAVGDVDGDGLPDLYVTRLDDHDLLFRNAGGGAFTDATQAAGLDAYDLQSNGAGFADVDNDGDLDLFVTTIGTGSPNDRNYLFINDGTGQFAEEAAARGADQTSTGFRNCFSVAFGDYDRDGWIDIHVTEWAATAGANGRLLRNQGPLNPGHFVDETKDADVEADNIRGFGSSLVDLDADGWPDLALTADFSTSKLFWNDGDGTFTDGTAAAGVGTDQNGMGATVGDIDGDGDLDWFVTAIRATESFGNWGVTGNRLYLNQGDRTFVDGTDVAGVRDGDWGWGAALFDADNDGDLDLVMTNGFDSGTSATDEFEQDPMRFWENDGFPMTERAQAAGLTATGLGRGLVVLDHDADGDLDLLVGTNGGHPHLYRNDTTGNDWLRVRTIGDLSNRDGYGAVVRVHTGGGSPRTAVVGSVTHFLGHSDPTAHVGLGALSAPTVDRVEVRWPSGKVQYVDDVSKNQTLLVEESTCGDLDGDDHCASADCDEADPATYDGATEINDGIDNQCDGNPGFGLVDEVDGLRFGGSPAVQLTWPPQPGATLYEVARGTDAAFSTCVSFTTLDAFWADADPPAGEIQFYLTRAAAPNVGSWGRRGDGAERTPACSPGR